MRSCWWEKAAYEVGGLTTGGGGKLPVLMEMMLMESRYLEYVMFIQSPDMIVGEWHGQSCGMFDFFTCIIQWRLLCKLDAIIPFCTRCDDILVQA
jgi:hypothetical protein